MTHWVRLLLMLVSPLALPLDAAAQGTPSGTVYGYILDPDYRPVPGTRVVIESVNSGETRDAVSNRDGLYSVPALDPGPYNLTVEKSGFKTIRQNGVVIETDQQARLDFALQVGSATESIIVQGGTPLLNSTDATVSTLIGNEFVTDLPLRWIHGGMLWNVLS